MNKNSRTKRLFWRLYGRNQGGITKKGMNITRRGKDSQYRKSREFRFEYKKKELAKKIKRSDVTKTFNTLRHWC